MSTAAATPSSEHPTAKLLRRLNQAVVDITGDSYFGSHPFFLAAVDANGDIRVAVTQAFRLAELLESVSLDRFRQVTPRQEIPGQLQLPFNND